jgi:hypothetical protein
MSNPLCFNKKLASAVADGIAQSQSPGTAALTLNGSLVAAGVATIDSVTSSNGAIGRRIVVTSGGDDTGITWKVTGTNSTGNKIMDIFAGVSGGDAQSNLDFVTVTSITPSGAVASTAIAGTNGVGSSPWQMVNYQGTQVVNIGLAVELVTGAANFTVQHTFDLPNNNLNLTTFGLVAGQTFSPLAFANFALNGASATVEGSYIQPIAAYRLLINSGTGQLRFRAIQTGIG